MKAMGYLQAHDLKHFAIREMEVPLPVLGEEDVLVCIKAISINPVDYKIRSTKSGSPDHPIILGWDAAGIVEKVGNSVRDFVVNDEVFYAGSLLKDGANSAYHVVDHRLIAKKPKNLSFAQSASLPLTSLTAWEALIERHYFEYTPSTKILIIGAAGGVGSAAIQILKAVTPATIIATASRPETVDWCQKMGADIIIDHTKDLATELKSHQIDQVDLVLGTNHSQNYVNIIPNLLRPFGYFCLIDDPKTLDIVSFKQKSLSVHWEFMFTKSVFNFNMQSQGEILQKIAKLVESQKMRSTENLVLEGLSVENLKDAHHLLEAKGSIGKIVITLA